MAFRLWLVFGVVLFTAVARADDPAKWPPVIARKLPPTAKPIDTAARQDLRTRVDRLISRAGLGADPDVLVYVKAVDYALRHEEFFDAKSDPSKAAKLLSFAELLIADPKLAAAPASNKSPNYIRGYRSKLDGSVQPYGLVIPPGLDLTKPVPLYVWLHGRGDTKCDLQFIAGFMGEKPVGPLQPTDAIVLHPFGRYCNGWKSAGEIDVLEAIADVKSKYRIDDDRIVLAGFSMGGAGAWHLGAHYADRWCAVHAGAGFVDVKRYQNLTAETMPPWYEQKLWGLYDVPDYRRNLLNVPLLAYSGEEDKQKAAADIMEAELAAEGLKLTHLIGPGMGHKYHPEVLIDIQKRLAEIVARGRNPAPSRVRLQTKTLRYGKLFWVEALGLKAHWEESRIDAQLTGPKSVVITTQGVTALKLSNPWGAGTPFADDAVILVDEQQVKIPKRAEAPAATKVSAATNPTTAPSPNLAELAATAARAPVNPLDGPKQVVVDGGQVRLTGPVKDLGTVTVPPQLFGMQVAQAEPVATAEELYLVKRGRGWVAERKTPFDFTPGKFRRKVPGLQGPIDDAFVEPFTVTQPTPGSSDSLVDRWVNFERQHFVDRWRMLMRGDCVNQPAAATPLYFDRNVVLWGTPKTNGHLKEILGRLPIFWNDKTVGMGDLSFDATKVVPMLIYPNPNSPSKYVVLNSGLTFREGHDRTNSLQNPKLGDWAFIDVTEPPTDLAPGKVLATGFFDEEWQYVPGK